MANRLANLQQWKLIAGIVLVCVGVAMVPGPQTGTVSTEASLLNAVLWRTAGALPTLVLAVWYSLQGIVLQPQGFSFCRVQAVLSGFLLLRVLARIA